MVNKDTVKGAKVVHAVRNRQMEYVSARGRNVVHGETYCGRHYAVGTKKKAAEVMCKTCLRVLRRARR